MDYTFWADIYSRTGAMYPVLSRVVVFLLAGGVALLLWWGVAQRTYEREQSLKARDTATDTEIAQLKTELTALRAARDSSDKRRRIHEALGKFFVEGEAFQRKFLDPNTVGPLSEGQAWLERLRTYVTTELGSVHLARLESASGQMPFSPTIADGPAKEKNRNAWIQINIRLMRIQEFISELSREY